MKKWSLLPAVAQFHLPHGERSPLTLEASSPCPSVDAGLGRPPSLAHTSRRDSTLRVHS